VLLGILQSFFEDTLGPSSFESRTLHCDNDSVTFGNCVHQYIRSQKLDLHVSPPNYHYQNGQVERAVQTILDKTRTLLAAGGASFSARPTVRTSSRPDEYVKQKEEDELVHPQPDNVAPSWELSSVSSPLVLHPPQ
jgi:hypothetical protein